LIPVAVLTHKEGLWLVLSSSDKIFVLLCVLEITQKTTFFSLQAERGTSPEGILVIASQPQH